MKSFFVLLIGFVMLGALITGCENAVESQTPVDSLEAEISQLETTANKFGTYAPAPSPLVTVSVGEDNLDFWPYTGGDFSSDPVCPINLIFIGEADPRDIRAALFSLDGDRTAAGFPDIPPFNDTWQDAIGFVEDLEIIKTVATIGATMAGQADLFSFPAEILARLDFICGYSVWENGPWPMSILKF